ncbi:enkurin-like [Syngnathus typhle]|uniref:enkurin-like n=2 Tax=Syngnathus typhle TaxID=161592 RepID=UPI002A6AE471|nr:enkurin-like [Syngnathus typhle]
MTSLHMEHLVEGVILLSSLGEIYPQDTVLNFIQSNVIMDKPKRYVSSSRQNNITTTVIELQHPANYLTKFSLQSKLPDNKVHVRNVYCTTANKKPMLSAGTFLLPTGLPAKKMFTAVPKSSKPPFCVVDTNMGHREFVNINSGLVPVYIRKKDYGEVPKYLLRRRPKPTKSPQEKSVIEVAKPEEPDIEKQTEEDFREVIEYLKKRLQKLNKTYMQLPLVIDTPWLKSRKLRMETDMTQVETDIELIETLVSNKST